MTTTVQRLKSTFIGMMFLFTALLGWTQSVKTYIPPQALQYVPIYKEEQLKYFPDFTSPAYFMALTEHESCISLKHSKCFNSKSELLSAREHGVGLSMLTVTYRADGSVRNDTLANLRKNYAESLSELSWLTIKQRPDLQIRAMYILTLENYRQFTRYSSDRDLLQMTDSAYNAGAGSIRRRAQRCSLTAGCDPKVWDGNLENHCPMSTKPLYAGRSACDINNHHVVDVIDTRMGKYSLLLK